MRYPASEKAEIIELVERSHLPAKRTLDKLGIPAPHSIAGTTDIERVGLRRWLTAGPSRIASGIASPMTSAARSSTWRWSFQSCRPASWPCGSPTNGSTLYRRLRSIGC